MKTRIEIRDKSLRRKSRVTFKIRNSTIKPVLYVFRSNKYIYAQIVDNSGKTLTGVTSKNVNSGSTEKSADSKTGAKVNISFETGRILAQKAKELKITDVVFNRTGYKYHGRVKALAEGARKGGLKF
jgi:large subunit ribosomal protein L18